MEREHKVFFHISLQEKAKHFMLLCLFAKKSYTFCIVALVYIKKLCISCCHYWLMHCCIPVFGVVVPIYRRELCISRCYVNLQERVMHLMLLGYFFALMCWFIRESYYYRVKLQPSMIIVLQGVRPRGQGHHLITPLKELPSLIYFTTTTQVVNKKSYKEQRRKVRICYPRTSLPSCN